MANRTDARTMFSEVLLDRIRDDQYPSYTQMAIFEQTAPMEMAPEYLEVLIEKVAREHRPSNTMLRHISQLLASVRA